MNALSQLAALGQSCWLDDLSRHLIRSGELARLVASGVRGVTSNPATFAKAIASSDYDRAIERAASAGRSAAETYEELAVADIREACDMLRRVYEETGGADGYVSLEVSPHLAHDTGASIAEGRRLAALVERPNLFIKIPCTLAGLPAIEELLYEGINVNITLLFSIPHYEAVAEAYLRALERRLAAGRPVDRIASVASLFLSRIDVLVDQLLRHRIVPGGAAREPDPQALLGKAATANAKLAYQSLKRIFAGARWQALAERGARVQRLLWASTGPKNPAYPPLMYVEPLIGPMTVNTMPEATIAAFLAHGAVRAMIEEGLPEARRVMADLERLGIGLDCVATQLENEGIEKFDEPFDALLRGLDAKRRRYAAAVELDPLCEEARRLRRLVIRMTTEAGSGHPTSCLSCADIIAALFFCIMRWDPKDPAARNVDTLVLSKGHAAPILWAALSEAGAISEDPLSLRRLGSSLEGHPTAANPWVRIATGALGQGLAAACGIAAANRLDGIAARVYCLLGDGECSEGAVWEAAQFAALNTLASLVAIVDMNALGQSGTAPYRHDSAVLARRFAAFGWQAVEIDGHDMAAVVEALEGAGKGGPTAIIARTVKGKGVSFLEGALGWHGKPLDRAQMENALAELGEPRNALAVAPRRVAERPAPSPAARRRIAVSHRLGEEVATRQAFGAALVKLGEVDPSVVVLDGDVRNSTGIESFAETFPDRFFEAYIAEQTMIGVALGLASCGKRAFAATFAAFLSRAYDFIRMSQYSRPAHLVLCGSHCGVSIGEDGPSQMGLEDLAMFRALIDSTVLYPADAVAAEKLTEAAAEAPGLVYIRTTRPKTPVIYGNGEEFPIGGSKILRTSPHDRVAIVAAGITVHEALAAHETLHRDRISARVIDAYSVKPLDVAALRRAAEETGRIVVVEDHACAGGLGEAVAAAIGPAAPVRRLGIAALPHSGTMEQLLDRYGISRAAIAKAVLEGGG
ncbi:MAG TPA: transketolase [Stellaceae bacterium]|nr:transketolase [Stellaceae bacterium]